MSVLFKTILCSIDFSVYSSQVIAWATNLAAVSGAELVVFHAISSPRERLALSSPRPDTIQCSKTALEQIDNLMAGALVSWQARVVLGDAVAEVRRAADDIGADLIVAASHGLSGIRRMVLGSVVERMAREIHRPLLVLRSQDGKTGEATAEGFSGNHLHEGVIAAACDLDPESPPVAAYAHCLACLLGRGLDLVHAATAPAPADDKYMDESYAGRQERHLESLRKAMKASIAGLSPVPVMENQKDVNVIATVLTGDPAEEILDFAVKSGAELMVVGVKHRTTFGKWITGSATEALIRSAPCHVLTVPVVEQDGRVHIKGAGHG